MTTRKRIKKLQIVLDVTVPNHAWQITYGSDPAIELADYITAGAQQCQRLLQLAPSGAENAAVTLAGHEVTLTKARPASEWTTVRIALDIELDFVEWQALFGLEPKLGVGPYVAAELTLAKPMLEELQGTVVYVPGLSGDIVGGHVGHVLGQI